MDDQNTSLVPNDPQNITLRELWHGMKLKTSAQLLPMGAGTDIKNLRYTGGGLRRVHSWKERQLTFTPLYDDVLLHADLVFTKQNILRVVVFGENFIYRIDTDGSTLEPLLYGIDYDDVAAPAELIWNTTNAFWALRLPTEQPAIKVSIGDYLEFGWDPIENDYDYKVQIKNILGQDLVFTSDDLTVDMSGDTFGKFRIRFTLSSRAPYIYDYLAVPGNLFFVDRSSRGIMRYNDDIGVPQELNFIGGAVNPSPTQINAIGFHDFRLWVGGFTSGGVRYPNRLLWGNRSSPLAPAFLEAEDETYFLDLVGPKTEILRIVSLGSLLVVYFGDAIFFGRPTNIIGLPYDFEMLNTGGLGLVGQRAVASLADGHYFVGRDDVYFFSAQGSLEKIGSEVVKRTIDVYKESLDQTWVVPDPKFSRILFCFKPLSSLEFEEVWAFDYEYKAWTYMDLSGSGLTQVSFVNAASWDSFYQGNNDVDADVELAFQWANPEFDNLTWEDYKPSGNFNQLLLMHNDRLFLQSDSAIWCSARGEVPEVVFESGDMDTQLPDITKTFTRLTLKLDDVVSPTADSINGVLTETEPELIFRVQVSNNRGRTWKECGILKIPNGTDEGKINFLLNGSLVRFRLTTNSFVDQYRITEIGLRARVAGLETTYK
jgi:hypothetical protein